MTIPNLDATGHWWDGTFALFNFQFEYQKGHENTVADALSQITTHLDPDVVRSILNGITLGAAYRSEVNDPTMVEGDHDLEQEVHVTAACVLIQMHMTDWAEAQTEDPVLSTVLDWIEAQKKTDLKTLLGEHASSEEGQLILWNWQNFMIHQKALYLHSMPKGKSEDLLLFVVLKAHWVATLNRCHRDAGHQGHDHTLSLLQECFWWPGMTNQMWQSIRTCVHCLEHEGGLSKPLYTLLWPLLLWISYMLIYQHGDNLGAKQVT